MEELDEIASTAVQIIRDLHKHEFGISEIHNSVLTAKERQYLRLVDEPTRVDAKSVKSAAFDGDSLRDITLFPLLESLDHVSDLVQDARNKLRSLETQQRGLEGDNEQLHSTNADLVRQISTQMRELRTQQQDMFGNEELQQYKFAVFQQKETKVKSAVLKEFITALVTATGVDWSKDERLTDLIMTSVHENDENDLM